MKQLNKEEFYLIYQINQFQLLSGSNLIMKELRDKGIHLESLAIIENADEKKADDRV